MTEAVGRDDSRLHVVAGLTPDETQTVLSAVAHYGFHGTLKAPFFLRAPDLMPALIEAVQTFAASQRPFYLPPLRLQRMNRFLALMPASASAELDTLAGACVRHFDPFRRAPSTAELARRRAAGLNARQEQHLVRWGYPYVFDEFRFHLTLAGPVNGDEMATRLTCALHARLDGLDLDAVAMTSVCLFIQERPDRPFRCHSRHALKQNTCRQATADG
jgi:hypothetical protein